MLRFPRAQQHWRKNFTSDLVLHTNEREQRLAAVQYVPSCAGQKTGGSLRRDANTDDSQLMSVTTGNVTLNEISLTVA